MHAGEVRASGVPELPEATTVAMPAARRLSMIGLYGCVSHGALKLPPPRLMLTAATAWTLRSSYTRSSAASTSESYARMHGGAPPQSKNPSKREKICTDM